MKHLKRKLMSATAMLMVSVMMLTGVSFAWYTISTNPEITGITTTISANQNLEIALDNGYADEDAVDAASVYNNQAGVQGSKSGNSYTWGNLVDLSTAFTSVSSSNATAPHLSLEPAAYVTTSDAAAGLATGLNTAAYGEDGRMSRLVTLSNATISNAVDGLPAEVNGGVYGWYGANAGANEYIAFSVDYWVRSNVEGNLTLVKSEIGENAESFTGSGRATASDATADSVNSIVGGGSYISGLTASMSNAMQVVFVPMTSSNAGGMEEVPGKAVFAKVGEFVSTSNAHPSGSNADEDKLGAVPLSIEEGKVISTLVEDEAQLVRMYVYLDGNKVNNDSAPTTDLSGVKINIQFMNADADGNDQLNDAMTAEASPSNATPTEP